MALLVGEAHDLILDGGAVARPGAVDGAGVHRRAVQVPPDDLVGFGRGVGEVTELFVFKLPIGQEGERHDRLIARLRLHFAKVDGAAVEARGRPGFETAQRKAQVAEGIPQGE